MDFGHTISGGNLTYYYFKCAGTMTSCELNKRNMAAISGCSCVTSSVCSHHLLDDALGCRLTTVRARLCVLLLSARAHGTHCGRAAHAVLLVRCVSVCVTSPLNLRYEMWHGHMCVHTWLPIYYIYIIRCRACASSSRGPLALDEPFIYKSCVITEPTT